MSWYSAVPRITLNGSITASDYVDILDNRVHPLVWMFPNNDAIFEDGSLPILTARSVQSWLEEHDNALQYLPWPVQLPDLNVIKPL